MMRSIVSPSMAYCACLVLIQAASSSFVQAGTEALSAAEIVRALKGRTEAVRNVHSVTLWELFPEGKPPRWVKITTDGDDLGRIRSYEIHGVYDESGKRIARREFCRVYNGEITVHFDYNYDVLKGPKRGDGSQTHASVFDGPNRTTSYGSPLTFLNMTSLLETLVRGGHSIALRRLDAARPNLYRIVISMPAGDRMKEYRFVYDHERKVIVSASIFDEAGKQLHQNRAADFKQVLPGLWVPLSGTKRKSSPTSGTVRGVQITSPAFEYRFRCLEFRVNDPGFSEDVFDIVLEPGTYVYDSRYQVDYRIGDERAIDEHLAGLAHAAKQEQAKDRMNNPLNQALLRSMDGRPDEPPQARWLPLWLLALNAAGLLVIFTAWTFYRRWRSARGSADP